MRAIRADSHIVGGWLGGQAERPCRELEHDEIGASEDEHGLHDPVCAARVQEVAALLQRGKAACRQVAIRGEHHHLSAHAIAQGGASPRRLLALTVLVAGVLSSVLANDVVVFAMTPLLCRGLLARGLDPRPFLIALACAANAGSAATIIGNPQNLLIGQVGGLGFWPFVAVCGVPALAALAVVHMVTLRVWRDALAAPAHAPAASSAAPPLDRGRLAKAMVAAAALIAVFTLPVDRAPWSLAIVGVLLVSRNMTTRQMLGMVDWHLLLLFAGLFTVTAAMADTGLPGRVLAALGAAGIVFSQSLPLAAVALAGSNTIGNVPLVVMLLASGLPLGTEGLYRLALFSTLSGNLLVVGSIANIIVVERARSVGVIIGFLDYTRVGVPVTALSLVFAWLWTEVLLPLLTGGP